MYSISKNVIFESSASYENYLQSEHWERIRTAALNRAGNRCSVCSAQYGLQVHHVNYDRVGAELPEDLLVVCDDCHKKIHDLRYTPAQEQALIDTFKPAKLPDCFVPVGNAKPAPLGELADGSSEAQNRQLYAAKKLNLPLEIKTRETGIHMRLIPPGFFIMGYAGVNNYALRVDAYPWHRVKISKPLYVGKYPITQAQWFDVMGYYPDGDLPAGHNIPVSGNDWYESQTLLKQLHGREKQRHSLFRLPFEAEWEYYCSAGTTTEYYTGNGVESLEKAGWYYDFTSDGHELGNLNGACEVGGKIPNAWGIYDCHGYLSEWCGDWYGEYVDSPVTDPRGPEHGTLRVVRGGATQEPARTSARSCSAPDDAEFRTGVRIIATVPSI